VGEGQAQDNGLKVGEKENRIKGDKGKPRQIGEIGVGISNSKTLHRLTRESRRIKKTPFTKTIGYLAVGVGGKVEENEEEKEMGAASKMRFEK